MRKLKQLLISIILILMISCSNGVTYDAKGLIHPESKYIKTYQYFGDYHLVTIDTISNIITDKTISYPEYLYINKNFK